MSNKSVAKQKITRSDKGAGSSNAGRAVNDNGRSFRMSAPPSLIAAASAAAADFAAAFDGQLLAPRRLGRFEAALLVLLGGGEKVEHGGGGQRHTVIRPREELNVEDAPSQRRRERGGRGGNGIEAGAVMSQQKIRDDVIAEGLRVGDGDRDILVRLRFDALLDVGPVAPALDRPSFHAPRRHHDAHGLALPNHAPEVAEGLRQRACGEKSEMRLKREFNRGF